MAVVSPVFRGAGRAYGFGQPRTISQKHGVVRGRKLLREALARAQI